MKLLTIGVFITSTFTANVAYAQTAKQMCIHHCALNRDACVRYASSRQQKYDCYDAYQRCVNSCR